VLIGDLEPADLARAIAHLPAAVYKNRNSREPALRASFEQVPAAGAVKEGGFADHNGEIVVRRGDAFEPLTLPATVRARIRGMLQVRDAVREVFRTQLSDAPNEAIVDARRHLNRTYDSFVARFGPLNARENVKAFSDDPDLPLLVSARRFRSGKQSAPPNRHLRTPHAGAIPPGGACRNRVGGAAGLAQRDRRNQLGPHGIAYRQARF